MPGSSTKKKKKDPGSQAALAAAETGSTKESEETSLGDDQDAPLLSKGRFLNEKVVGFKQLHPETFKEIISLFDDESKIMVMISACESYGNTDEFGELLSLNVGVVHAVIAKGRFTKEALFPGSLSRSTSGRRLRQHDRYRTDF